MTEMMSLVNVAIDGPASAGKTSTAKKVAKILGYKLIDTGAIYRSIAWYALDSGVPLDDADTLGDIARTKEICFVEGGKVFIDGNDVTDAIRTPEIDKAVTPVSACPKVREALLPIQRQLAAGKGAVMEGRDIGTTVLPDAEVKVFLTATPENRARRRYEQNLAKGKADTYEETLVDINRRDTADSTRAASPLRQADDAYLLDNSNMTEDETVAFICGMVRGIQRML